MTVSQPTTVAEALAWGERELPVREGLLDPRREAHWLLARALGRDETWLLIHPEAEVPASAVATYRQWLVRRAAGEPAHHLLGSCPFWGRDFVVSPATLVPRPETELLVQAALALKLAAAARVVDVGTGTACIAVSLALARPRWQVMGVDRSLPALAVAWLNVAALRAPVALVAGHLAAAVGGPVDLVVANLPYIPSARLAGLPVEVRHDPVVALDGGPDGLALVRRLLADAPRVLARQGHLVLELGEGQAAPALQEAEAHGLTGECRARDLGGVERVLVLRRD